MEVTVQKKNNKIQGILLRGRKFGLFGYLSKDLFRFIKVKSQTGKMFMLRIFKMGLNFYFQKAKVIK